MSSLMSVITGGQWTEFVHKEMPALEKFWKLVYKFFNLKQIKSMLMFFLVNVPEMIYVCFAVAMISFSKTKGNDDGFISLVFGRNLGHGYGAVYNLGERVEGFTNPFIVLVTAILVRIGVPDNLIPYAIMALCILAGVVTIIAIYHYGKRVIGTGPSWAVALIIALCPSLAFWAGSVLESSIFVLAVILVYVLVSRIDEDDDSYRHLKFTGYLVGVSLLTLLTRSDGFLVLFLIPLFFFLKGKWQWGSISSATTSLLTSLGFGIRYFYYGRLLPNTAYAKVDGLVMDRIANAISLLWKYGFSTSVLLPVLLLLVVTISACGNVIKNRSMRTLPFEAIFFPAWLGYYLWVGGDVYYERPLVPLFPLGVYVLVKLFRGIGWNRTQLMAAMVCVFFGLFPSLPNYYSFILSRNTGQDGWLALGTYLEKHNNGESIAVDAAGKIRWAFKSTPYCLDMLGLCDSHIASLPVQAAGPGRLGHCKWDNEYMFGKHPDLIASWLAPDLSMPLFSLFQEHYRNRGYEVRYLLNVSSGDIQDVKGLEEEKIKAYVSEGWNYGVLERSSTVLAEKN